MCLIGEGASIGGLEPEGAPIGGLEPNFGTPWLTHFELWQGVSSNIPSGVTKRYTFRTMVPLTNHIWNPFLEWLAQIARVRSTQTA